MRLSRPIVLFLSLPVLAQGPCDCIDRGDIKERLKRVNNAIKAYGKEMAAVGASTYTAAGRKALQARVEASMGATPGRIPLHADGYTTNNCDIEVKAPTKCLEAAIRAHEKVHQDACKATWEKHQKEILMGRAADRFEANKMTMAGYIMEEVTGYQAEIQFLTKELARLERDCKPKPPPRHSYTTSRGVDSSEGSQPAGQGGPRPIGPPPMVKPKPMPTPPPIK